MATVVDKSGNAPAVDVAGNPAGTVEAGVNLGVGIAVFKEKVGTTLRFKTLVAGDNITAIEDDTSITISGEEGGGGGSGETNTFSDSGGGTSIRKEKNGVDFVFKSIIAGANIQITSEEDTITIIGDVDDVGITELYENGISAKTNDYTIALGDMSSVLIANKATAIAFTLPSADITANMWFDVFNINDGACTITETGGLGINRAGNDSLVLQKDQWVRFVYRQDTDPRWIAQIVNSVVLTDDQYVAGDGARDDVYSVGGHWTITAAGTRVICLRMPWTGTVISVDLETDSGTCDVVINDDGAAITGFGSAVGATATIGNTVSGASVAAGSKLEVVVSNPSSLTGLAVNLRMTRTA